MKYWRGTYWVLFSVDRYPFDPKLSIMCNTRRYREAMSPRRRPIIIRLMMKALHRPGRRVSDKTTTDRSRSADVTLELDPCFSSVFENGYIFLKGGMPEQRTKRIAGRCQTKHVTEGTK